jgi:hypothetical protein
VTIKWFNPAIDSVSRGHGSAKSHRFSLYETRSFLIAFQDRLTCSFLS